MLNPPSSALPLIAQPGVDPPYKEGIPCRGGVGQRAAQLLMCTKLKTSPTSLLLFKASFQWRVHQQSTTESHSGYWVCLYYMIWMVFDRASSRLASAIFSSLSSLSCTSCGIGSRFTKHLIPRKLTNSDERTKAGPRSALVLVRIRKRAFQTPQGRAASSRRHPDHPITAK